MKGTQAPRGESVVIRVDRRMYDQLLEWSNIEGVPIRLLADAVLWAYFSEGHHHRSVRRLVVDRARAIRDSIRETGRSKAEEKLPRWRHPRSKPTIPPPPPVPRPPSEA